MKSGKHVKVKTQERGKSKSELVRQGQYEPVRESHFTQRRGKGREQKGQRQSYHWHIIIKHILLSMLVSTNYKPGSGFEQPELAEGVPAHDGGAAKEMIFKVHLSWGHSLVLHELCTKALALGPAPECTGVCALYKVHSELSFPHWASSTTSSAN